MKAIGIALLVIGLIVAIVPAYNNCDYEGKSIPTAAGSSVPMKCFWTAMAAPAVGVTLALVGVLLALSKRRETRLMLTMVAAVLSAFAIALPTTLIGVCKMDALCVNVLKPTLMFAGGLGIVLSAAGFFLSWRQTDEVPPSEGAAA